MLNFHKSDKLNVSATNLREEWQRFKHGFLNFLIASELDKESSQRQVSIFLNLAGEEVQDLLETLGLNEAAKICPRYKTHLNATLSQSRISRTSDSPLTNVISSQVSHLNII